MRARIAVAFLIGFAAGMAALGAVLWSTGHLVTHQEVATATSPVMPGTPPPDAVASASASPPAPSLPPADIPKVAPPAPVPLNEADRTAAEPRIEMPLANIDPHTLTDTFTQVRTGHMHEALDIMAPRGTPVMAVAEGNVAKLFNSKQGGNTVYQFDNSRTWCYYYAHLDRYAPGLKEGTLLRKGDVLGYVGATGDASPDAPHLHFAVFKLGPGKKWWQGTSIDPLPLLTH